MTRDRLFILCNFPELALCYRISLFVFVSFVSQEYGGLESHNADLIFRVHTS
jgi:hypothetical protein